MTDRMRQYPEKNMLDVSLPEYALSYLINNDDSGISRIDKGIIDNWIMSISANSYTIIDVDTREPFFSWEPAFGLACTCVDATLIFR